MKLLLGLITAFLVSTVALGQAIKVSPERAQRAEAATKARLGYAASPEYNPYDTDVGEIKNRCWQLIQESKFKEAIAEADRGLKKDRYNIEILMAKSEALREAAGAKAADDARDQWMAAMDSVLLSGDGKSFGTAFRVISVEEEYAAIHIMRLQTSKQALVGHDSSQFDVISVRTSDGQEFDLYFNIDLPKGWLDRKIKSAAGNSQDNGTSARVP